MAALNFPFRLKELDLEIMKIHWAYETACSSARSECLRAQEEVITDFEKYLVQLKKGSSEKKTRNTM